MNCVHVDFLSEQTMEVPMDALPPELLLMVFSFLNIVNLCRCAGVFKYWHQLACDTSNWRHVNFSLLRHVTEEFLMNMSQWSGRFLKCLNLDGCMNVTDRALRCLAENCCNMINLDLNGCESITNESCRMLALHCQRLVRLSLARCSYIAGY